MGVDLNSPIHITNDAQCVKYRRIFELKVERYEELHQAISSMRAKFRVLGGQLLSACEGSDKAELREARARVRGEYLRDEEAYGRLRKEWGLLHDYMTRIKTAVSEYASNN